MTALSQKRMSVEKRDIQNNQKLYLHGEDNSQNRIGNVAPAKWPTVTTLSLFKFYINF